MCAGFSSYTKSIKNNRSLQKGGRKSFFKEMNLTSSQARGNATFIDIDTKIENQAFVKKKTLKYIQRGIVFLVFLGLWWYVYNL